MVNIQVWEKPSFVLFFLNTGSSLGDYPLSLSHLHSCRRVGGSQAHPCFLCEGVSEKISEESSEETVQERTGSRQDWAHGWGIVCWGSCNNRCTTHGKAYTTDIYFLIVPGAPSLRSTFRQGHFLLRAVREGSAPRLSLRLVGGHLLPVSSFCTRLRPDLLLS